MSNIIKLTSDRKSERKTSHFTCLPKCPNISRVFLLKSNCILKLKLNSKKSRNFHVRFNLQADQRQPLVFPLRRVHRPLPLPLSLSGRCSTRRHGDLRERSLASLQRRFAGHGQRNSGYLKYLI